MMINAIGYFLRREWEKIERWLKSDSRPMLRQQVKEWQQLEEGYPKQQQAWKGLPRG
jgi:hypothetical protein